MIKLDIGISYDRIEGFLIDNKIRKVNRKELENGRKRRSIRETRKMRRMAKTVKEMKIRS